MHGFTHMLRQGVRLGKGRIVGLKQVLEHAAGHERCLPPAVCVRSPCAAPPAPSLRDPSAPFLGLTTSSIASRDFVIAVGPPVTRRPPHGSRRAVFPHRALQPYSLPHSSSGHRGCLSRLWMPPEPR